MTVWKETANVATIEALGAGPAFPASGMIDGVILEAEHRVLVKDQLIPTENGYYKVVAGGGGPPTLMATGDTIGAEDVIRVSQGDRNAHTAWALIDAKNRIFVRQDIKHYSLKSIDELKRLWQVLPDATASVSGYWRPGDKGGGDFAFLGVPDYARVISAVSFDISISNVTNVDGLVTITATAHGIGDIDKIITRVYIKGLNGLVDGAYYVKVEDVDTLTLPGYFTGVSFIAGAKVQYVKLVTKGPHNRANGQRVSVAGVLPSNGAAPIAGIHDGCGVINATSLLIPIETSGGMYTPGPNALIGDDGLTVPATDEEGNAGGLWQRLRADHIDVRWFGAKADWTHPGDWFDPIIPLPDPTDDLPAFNAAIAALGTRVQLSNFIYNTSRKAGKVVAEGSFFLSNTLHITKAVELVGAGNNSFSLDAGPWRPATVLAFPANTTGIRIHSEYRDDSPDGGSAHHAVIRDLMIVCTSPEKPDCLNAPKPEGHGIHASAAFSVEHVNIENFWGNGINVVATGSIGPEAGNADGSYLEDCTAGQCGCDGFHFRGGDAQASVISRCSGVANGRAGFYDETFGNTYIGCHSEGNIGPNYITEFLSNASVFINCWSENGSPPSRFHGAATIISGKIGGNPQYMTPGSSAFILEHGVATRAPLVYKNLGLRDDGTKATCIGCSLGSMSQTNQSPDLNMIAFEWATFKSAGDDIEDSISLSYLAEPGVPPESRGHGWWALAHNNSLYRHMIRLPTTRANARLPAPWFVNGIYLGRDDIGPPKVSFTAAPNPPNTQDDGKPLTYERGDVVWNSEPSAGGPIGRVCLVGGTLTFLFGFQTVDSVNPGDTMVTLNKVNGLTPGQYITIGDGTDVYKITKVTGPTINIDKGALKKAPSEAAVEFTIPIADPVNLGDTTVALKKMNDLAPGQYITIGDGTDVYKIMKVTLPTIDIPAPGVLDTIGYAEAIALVGGTLAGSITVAVSANMGETTVTLNEVDGLEPGQSITIGKNTYEIMKVTRPTIYIDKGALASVPIGKAVVFSLPTFSTFGEVINIGTSTSCDASKSLTLADRYVTVTQNGTILRLPISPMDGQTHSIKCKAGVTTRVETADSVSIDGELTVTVESLENRTFRYSDMTREWEIR